MKSKTRLSHRITLFLVLLCITIAGISTKFYTGVGANWIGSKLGGLFYVWFFCLLFQLINPKMKSIIVAIIVFVGTSALEFTQLYHRIWIDSLREYFLVHALIGSSFSSTDFIYYLIGSGIAYLNLILIDKRFSN